MFHEGDLQSGIALAVQQKKSVICFVADEHEESTIWEQWLADDAVLETLVERAVTLKFPAESQEAGFLAAFCPITNTPTLVVIYQGQLAEQLKNGVTKDDFTSRLLAAITLESRTVSAHNAPPETNSITMAPMEDTQDPEMTSQTRELVNTEPPQASVYSQSYQSNVSSSNLAAEPSTSAPTYAPSSNVQTVLDERRQRLEAERKAQEAAEKAARNERIKARRLQEEADTNSTSSLPKDRSYEAEQAKRKREAKADRERILRQIENDKIARREREERRRAAAKAEQEGIEPTQAQQSTPTTKTSSSTSTGSTCALQIRLADGSNIRNTFPATSTLSTTVRPWIATETSDSSPFTLKLIQTPHPSRTLTDSDEAMTLQELALLPSATLIMVPVRNSLTSAYPGTAGGASIFAKIYSFIAAILLRLYELVQAFLGNRQAAAGPVQASPSRSSEGSSAAENLQVGAADAKTSSAEAGGAAVTNSRIRIRTLRDQRPESDDQQTFYNGNQTSFQPRKDDRATGEAKEEGPGGS